MKRGEQLSPEELSGQFSSATEGTSNIENGRECLGAARLYEEQLLLRREIARLHDEIDLLRQNRDALEEVEELDKAPSISRENAKLGPAGPWIFRGPWQTVLIVIIALVALLGGRDLLAYFDSYESTDDAQVDAHINPISARISGTVLQVFVDDNDPVSSGQLLVDVDPRGYQMAVEQGQANYDQALAFVDTSMEDYKVALALLRAGRAADDKAQRDAGRYTILSHKGVASDEQYDEASVTAQVDSATVAEEAAAAEAAAKEHVAREASAAAAKAALDQELLDLGYTKISAPVSGIAGERSVEVGQHIDPGQQLLAIVRDNDLWVTANFKETQLARMRAGERATIHVDTFDTDYEGYVESLAGASGDKYSLLPPENATGNYVKIVQRVPVRIRLSRRQDISRLRPGMSVEATVWLK